MKVDLDGKILIVTGSTQVVADDIDPKKSTVEAVERVITGMEH